MTCRPDHWSQLSRRFRTAGHLAGCAPYLAALHPGRFALPSRARCPGRAGCPSYPDRATAPANSDCDCCRTAQSSRPCSTFHRTGTFAPVQLRLVLRHRLAAHPGSYCRRRPDSFCQPNLAARLGSCPHHHPDSRQIPVSRLGLRALVRLLHRRPTPARQPSRSTTCSSSESSSLGPRDAGLARRQYNELSQRLFRCDRVELA